MDGFSLLAIIDGACEESSSVRMYVLFWLLILNLLFPEYFSSLDLQMMFVALLQMIAA